MIEKINNNLVLTLPLNDLVGYSDGKQFSINYLIDMSYKGKDPQLGCEVIMFMDKEELEKECKKLGLQIWEYNRCVECDKVLLGTHTLNDKGYICEEHLKESVEELDKK